MDNFKWGILSFGFCLPFLVLSGTSFSSRFMKITPRFPLKYTASSRLPFRDNSVHHFFQTYSVIYTLPYGSLPNTFNLSSYFAWNVTFIFLKMLRFVLKPIVETMPKILLAYWSGTTTQTLSFCLLLAAICTFPTSLTSSLICWNKDKFLQHMVK